MNRFAWMVRREIWEHRAIWIAPAVVLALMLVGAITGNVFLGNIQITTDSAGTSITSSGQADDAQGLSKEDIEELSSIRGTEDLHKLERLEKLEKNRGETRSVTPGEALALVEPEKREGMLAILYAAVAGLMFFVLAIIGFFYALDSLYADRRDRSVLFWKSLPLSDTETVLSKFFVAAVAIPAVAALASIAGQLIMAAGGSLKLAFIGGPAGLMWMPQVLGGGAVGAIALAIICALWYAPIVGYLLLASAWAPKSPFLWAMLPPVALALLEKIAFGSSHVIALIKYRTLAPLQALFSAENIKEEAVRSIDIVGNIVALLTSPGMALGLVVAAALLAAAIWVRRYQDESI
jgi:ABC-2 type transport system permease protein